MQHTTVPVLAILTSTTLRNAIRQQSPKAFQKVYAFNLTIPYLIYSVKLIRIEGQSLKNIYVHAMLLLLPNFYNSSAQQQGNH